MMLPKMHYLLLFHMYRLLPNTGSTQFTMCLSFLDAYSSTFLHARNFLTIETTE